MNMPDHHNAGEFLHLFEMTPDWVCIAAKNGYFIDFNPAVPNTLGYSREELMSRLISDNIHPDDKAITASTRAQLLEGKALLNFQNRYLTKNGEVIWMEWTSVYLPSKEVVFAIAKNITARKRIELEIEARHLQYRQLAVHLKNNMEQDRKFLATELHEGVAQLATALKFDLELMHTQPDGVEKRLEHALVTVNMLVDTIRRTSFLVSPAILDDLGLDAALEWYCREFSQGSGLSCTYTGSYNENLFPKDVQLDLFRICQDAFNCISKHHRATRIKVAIRKKAGKQVLSIEDNGAGFSNGNTSHLLSVHQRAQFIQADYDFSYQEGQGHRMEISLNATG